MLRPACLVLVRRLLMASRAYVHAVVSPPVATQARIESLSKPRRNLLHPENALGFQVSQ